MAPDLTNLGYEFRVVSLNSMHAQALGPPAPQSRDRLYIVCWLEGKPAPDFEQSCGRRAWCPRCDEIVESQQAWKNGHTVGRYRQPTSTCTPRCGTVVEPGLAARRRRDRLVHPGQRIGDRLKPQDPRPDRGRDRPLLGTVPPRGRRQPVRRRRPEAPQHGDPNAYYRAWPTDEVLRTLHTTESKALVVPVEGRDGKQAQPIGWPLRTQTTRAETAMVTPFVAELRGGASDARSLGEPLRRSAREGTTTPGHAALRHRGRPPGSAHHPVRRGSPHTDREWREHVAGHPGWRVVDEDARPVSEYLRTLTTRDPYALVSPYYGIADHASRSTSRSAPLPPSTGTPWSTATNSGGAEMTTPASEYLRTLTTAGHQSLLQRARSGRPSDAADLRAARRTWFPSACSGCSSPRGRRRHGVPRRLRLALPTSQPAISNRDLVDGRERRHPTRRPATSWPPSPSPRRLRNNNAHGQGRAPDEGPRTRRPSPHQPAITDPMFPRALTMTMSERSDGADPAS